MDVFLFYLSIVTLIGATINPAKGDPYLGWNNEEAPPFSQTGMKSDSSRHNDWFPLANGYEYKVIFTKQSWQKAKSACRAWNGNLAAHGMKDYGTRVAIGNILLLNDFVWIGLTDLGSDGRWRYVDGTPASGGNAHWRPHEPNGHTHENCACMKRPHHYKSLDISCNKAMAAVCERKSATRF